MLLAVIGQASLADDYVVRPGDRLRLSVQGMSDYTEEHMIGTDGTFASTLFADLPVVGKTVAEIHDLIREAAPKLVIRRYGADGRLDALAIDAEQIAVVVTDYRPITVTGGVKTPGRYAFEPQLTVRAAIAMAGGRQRALLDDVPDPLLLLRLENELVEEIFGHAEQTARAWRLSQSLAGERLKSPPQAADVYLDAATFQDVVAAQLRVLDEVLAELAAKNAAAAEIKQSLNTHISLLEEQMQTHDGAADVTRREAERLNDAMERGLARTADLVDAQRVSLIHEMQRQTLREQLSNARLSLVRHRAATEEWHSARKLELMEALRDARRQLHLSDDRIKRTSAALETAPGSTGRAKDLGDIVVYRVVEGEERVLALAPHDFVAPGDVVELIAQRALSLPRNAGLALRDLGG